MNARWQRREFLRLALLQLGAWPLASALGCGDTVVDVVGDGGVRQNDVLDAAASSFQISPALRNQIASLDRGRLLDTFFDDGDRALVADVGVQYLLAIAPNGDAMRVRAALQGAMSVLERSMNDTDAIDALVAAITAEFSARNVTDLAGWTFAPTELALCALLWIAEKRDAASDPEADAG